MVSQLIEQNRDILRESQLELAQLVKKDGRITLEPSFSKVDSHETKLKSAKAFYFRINVAELSSANLSIRVDLRSHEEVNQAVRHTSSLSSGLEKLEHL